jgi:ATP-dependent Clp protease ATP-binding subunit ClpC
VDDVLNYLLALFTVGIVFAIAFRKELRAHLRRRREAARAEVLPPTPLDAQALTSRLYELDKVFAPFGSDAAHPGDLYIQPDFREAVRLLALPSTPLATVMQYVEGNSWSLSCAALAALKGRSDRNQAADKVLKQCEHYSAWAMFFALEVLFDVEPRIPAGAPLASAQEWWVDNRWMPNILRDYLVRCEARGDEMAFGRSLWATGASPKERVRRFLITMAHPIAAAFIKEIDDGEVPKDVDAPVESPQTLNAVGRFWKNEKELEILVDPDGWKEAFALAESALRQHPPRSLLVAGEPLVGKSSFLRLFAQRIAGDGWTVFEASGADLQADQIYIGQLEGRIRQVVEELTKGRRMIWYMPDIVQLALSGTHSGQSATMLDQILPAITAGRLVVWAEATPEGVARLVRLKPSLRGVFETVTLEPLPADDTLSLAREVIGAMTDKMKIRFDDDCANVTLDTSAQYLGGGSMPGAVLLILKLTALRAQKANERITARHILETLSQISGLPLGILDTREQLDLKSVRGFFSARVLGQDEAVSAVVDRIAMLKAGLNDPDKPIGVFLFAGPTGTGKTELAKAVSEFLFGSVERMIRLDMSEFQSPESMIKILGQSSSSAADADSLIGRVRKQPFSVLLLDEFEKSHPMIWDLFLQAFDEGRLTDAMGQTADLRHCLIIMTSNLGATSHRSLGLGFAPKADEFSKEQVLRAISQTYRPEFQNRLDKVIVFHPLTRELMRGILRKELAGLLERRGLKDRAWAIEWESSALEFLLERGFSPEMGARPLKRAIDQYVVAPLAAIIVEKRFPEGEQFLFVRSDGNAIQVEFVDPDADAAAAEESLTAAPSGPAAPPALISAILTPNGSRTEFQMLQAEFDDIGRTLDGAEWNGLKEKLSDDMSAADFWSRPDRFVTLARFALMDRVRAAAETANALRRRLERYNRSPPRYSGELSGRLALQLHLVRAGITDAFENSPIELVLAIEPVFDSGGERQVALAWCDRLRAMYRGWASKRHMQVTEAAGTGRDKDQPILTVGGFGAYRILSQEAGLHVFEPSEGAPSRVTARVRIAVVPLGDVPAAKERKLILDALEQTPRTNAVVRRYREEPPLVRDAAGKWRTGRFDLVLGGDFDLLQAGER